METEIPWMQMAEEEIRKLPKVNVEENEGVIHKLSEHFLLKQYKDPSEMIKQNICFLLEHQKELSDFVLPVGILHNEKGQFIASILWNIKDKIRADLFIEKASRKERAIFLKNAIDKYISLMRRHIYFLDLDVTNIMVDPKTYEVDFLELEDEDTVFRQDTEIEKQAMTKWYILCLDILLREVDLLAYKRNIVFYLYQMGFEIEWLETFFFERDNTKKLEMFVSYLSEHFENRKEKQYCKQ